ncbi:hypothetical protein [Citrobacter werkmanii]|uniref:hypothetical protein n=1 Tax=Citrobacter werkmanii TaxID=67827 RepID=UPI000EF1DA7D|nr:hypothetical protein [Citrobacter werkmanii]AYL68926.1 hypothetical protein CUC50_24240 [Citrobacter werkmanii]
MTSDEALPERLYHRLLQHVSTLFDSLAHNSEDLMLASAQEQARMKLNAIKAAINHAIDELRHNAEHKTFTIAFYGETNAGKSTLIETLRILFKESSKQAQREQFIALQQQSGLSEETLQALEAEISACREQHGRVQLDIDQTIERHDKWQQDHLLQEASLVTRIAQIKADANFLQRIFNFLRKLPEEKALLQLQTCTANLSAQRDADLRPLYQLSETIEAQLATESLKHTTILNNLYLLAAYGDGSIIGDGRSDFTRQTQEYEFEQNGQAFKLLDVPGIEGDESKVCEQVNIAVKRAHAVFYVTAKATPPQTGDGSRPGTLEKIKAQLGDQTEVWTVYNKRVTNPLALQKTALVSTDERAALGDLDRIMSEQLGDHYRRSITLCALPAFYATATCLVPRSTAAASRNKFLDAFDPDTLMDKTGVGQFSELLTQQLVTNVQEKIRHSNLNKVKKVLINVCAGIKTLQTDIFAPLAAQLDDEAQTAQHQFDMAFKSLKARLRATGEESISIFEEAVRTQIYDHIKRDINNDQFKEALEQLLKEENSNLQHQLPKALDKQITRFQSDVSDIIKRFEVHARELMEGYSQVTKIRITSEFELKIDIDNGISLWGLLGGLAAAGLMIWNPVAWPLMALSGLGIFINLIKAVWGFFDADYKKSQQRKAADTNLKKASDAIRKTFADTLVQALPPLQKTLVQIEHSLKQPAVQARHINQTLDVAHLGLKKMACDLTD